MLGVRHRVVAVARLGACTLVTALLAATLVAQAPLADVDARTTAPTTLRAKPDITARALARLPAETVVHIIGCDNDWCQVGVRRRVGYLPRGVLAAVPPALVAEEERTADTVIVFLDKEGSADQVFLESVVEERPEVLSGPRLAYPHALRMAGIQGRVLVRAIIDTNGRAEPASIRILQSPDTGFDQSARDFVLQAQFRPARVKGHAVRVLVNLPIDYKIRRRVR